MNGLYVLKRYISSQKAYIPEKNIHLFKHFFKDHNNDDDGDFQNDFDNDEKPDTKPDILQTNLMLFVSTEIDSTPTGNERKNSDNGDFKNKSIKTETTAVMTTPENVPKKINKKVAKDKKGSKINLKSKKVSEIKQKVDSEKEEIKKEKPVKSKFVKLTKEQKRERRHEKLKGICPVCGIFSKNVSEHIKRKHTETKQVNESVECDYCHRILSDKKYLRKHFKSHFQVRLVNLLLFYFYLLNRIN